MHYITLAFIYKTYSHILTQILQGKIEWDAALKNIFKDENVQNDSETSSKWLLEEINICQFIFYSTTENQEMRPST